MHTLIEFFIIPLKAKFLISFLSRHYPNYYHTKTYRPLALIEKVDGQTANP